MIKPCMIILSCFLGSYDGPKLAACAINANDIFAVEYQVGETDRLYLYLRTRSRPFSTIKETPSQVVEKVNGCK